jgi:hypothetical protein
MSIGGMGTDRCALPDTSDQMANPIRASIVAVTNREASRALVAEGSGAAPAVAIATIPPNAKGWRREQHQEVNQTGTNAAPVPSRCALAGHAW